MVSLFLMQTPTSRLMVRVRTTGLRLVFVHQTAIKSSGFRFLKEGEKVLSQCCYHLKVEFDISDGVKGKVAKNVCAPGGLPINRVLV